MLIWCRAEFLTEAAINIHVFPTGQEHASEHEQKYTYKDLCLELLQILGKKTGNGKAIPRPVWGSVPKRVLRSLYQQNLSTICMEKNVLAG